MRAKMIFICNMTVKQKYHTLIMIKFLFNVIVKNGTIFK